MRGNPFAQYYRETRPWMHPRNVLGCLKIDGFPPMVLLFP